jgi:hypothetical protein
MPTKRTTVLLDVDLLDRLGRFARRERTTKTAVIAAALETWLSEHAVEPSLPFVAIGRSGHGRLSLDARSIARRTGGRLAGTEPR